MPWVSSKRLGQERNSGRYSHQDSPKIDISEEGEETAHYGLKSRPPPPPAFRFGYKRQPIDWRILHGIDIQRLVSVIDCAAAISLFSYPAPLPEVLGILLNACKTNALKSLHPSSAGYFSYCDETGG